jgi:hypothetical protein
MYKLYGGLNINANTATDVPAGTRKSRTTDGDSSNIDTGKAADTGEAANASEASDAGKAADVGASGVCVRISVNIY